MQGKTELEEKTISSKQVFDGKLLKVFSDSIELPNGKEATREYIKHPGAVCVLPLTDDGFAIMVEQFRYPFHDVLLEVPAGKLEYGEDPSDGVKRELEEECGVVADNIDYIGTTYTTVAFTDEKIHTYLATGLKFVDSHPDDDEFLKVRKIKFSDLVDMVFNNQIKDSKTQIAIIKTKYFLENK